MGRRRRDGPPGPGDGAGQVPEVRRYNDGYSLFVGWMKFVLPGAAAILLGMIFVWPYLANTARDLRNSMTTSIRPDDVRNLQMVAPKYVGVDNKNQPYRLTAKLASQATPNADMIDLDSPKGTVSLNSGSRINLVARHGTYSQKNRRIVLTGDVNIFHDDGYTFRTDRAEIDLETGLAHGEKPVTVSGPKGTLAAQGFKILDKGDRVIFTGRTRIVLKVDDQDVKQILDVSGETPPGSQKTGIAEPHTKSPARRAGDSKDLKP